MQSNKEKKEREDRYLDIAHPSFISRTSHVYFSQYLTANLMLLVRWSVVTPARKKNLCTQSMSFLQKINLAYKNGTLSMCETNGNNLTWSCIVPKLILCYVVSCHVMSVLVRNIYTARFSISFSYFAILIGKKSKVNPYSTVSKLILSANYLLHIFQCTELLMRLIYGVDAVELCDLHLCRLTC